MDPMSTQSIVESDELVPSSKIVDPSKREKLEKLRLMIGYLSVAELIQNLSPKTHEGGWQ